MLVAHFYKRFKIEMYVKTYFNFLTWFYQCCYSPIQIQTPIDIWSGQMQGILYRFLSTIWTWHYFLTIFSSYSPSQHILLALFYRRQKEF